MFGRASGYNWKAVSVALGPVGLCLEGSLENPNCSRLMMMPIDAASLCVRARCNDVELCPSLPQSAPPPALFRAALRATDRAHRPGALPRTAKLGRH